MEEKKWWASRSIWSLIVALACVVAGIFGVDIDEATKEALLDNTVAVVSAIGAVVGIISGAIFRMKATKTIKK